MSALSEAHRSGTGTLLVDLDGTLVDSSGAHYLAFQRALSEHGSYRRFDYRQIAGMSSPDAARKLGVSDAEVEGFVEAKRRYYLAAVAAGEIAEIPGAGEMVTTASRFGWRQALVTSASRGSVDGLGARFDWFSEFEVVVCGDDVSAGKPEPESFLAAMNRLEVPPEACVGIEDSEAGIAALEAAGVRSISVSPDPIFASETLAAISSELKSLGAIDGRRA